jgi:hypothetical protein
MKTLKHLMETKLIKTALNRVIIGIKQKTQKLNKYLTIG